MRMRLTIAVVVLMAVTAGTLGIQWLSLATSSYAWNRTSHCVQAKNQQKLHSTQISLCKRNLELMTPTTIAARDVVDVCMEVFARNRWNCTSVTTAPDFMPDLTTGTREQGYVYALASAGIVHSVAKACSAGYLTSCGCSRVPKEPPVGNFKWGGCGDNLPRASDFGRQFTDKPWKQKEAKDKVVAAINRHNNRLGRRVVSTSLKIQCKCHGVSGSCNAKTCWKALPSVRDIGERLKLKYQTAVEVEMKPVGSKRKLRPVNSQIASHNKDDLIYITKSPDYCLPDARSGSLGTRGRECNVASSGQDSCDSMCCGRGYRTFLDIRTVHCHCKYQWCCDVICKSCIEEKEYHICE